MARKIHFFTGKGGTGKSLVAMGYAMAQADQGQKVLLIEVGEISFFEGIFANGPIDFEPKEVFQNLFVAHWDGPSCLRDYIQYLVKSEALTKIIYDNPFMRRLIDVGPALAELAVVGKITSGIRQVGPPLNFDQIIVDSYATGHMLALLRAPIGIAEAVKFGPMAHHCRDIIRVLRNSQITSYYIVTLPEELPTTESIELYNGILMEVGMGSQFICNCCLEIPVTSEELQRIQRDDQIGQSMKVFAKYIEDKMAVQAEQLSRLEAEAKPVWKVPRFLDLEPTTMIKNISQVVSRWKS